MTIYEFCGFTFIGLASSYMCLAVGTINLKWRMVGLGTLCLFSCFNFAAIITSAVYRFNDLGRLAALSTCPTKYDAKAAGYYFVNDKWTYESEANVISWIWTLQMLTFLANCCVNHHLNKIPGASEVRYRTASTAEEFEAL